MRTLDLPPFELLEHRGMKLAYDPQEMVFLRLDDVDWDCLRAPRDEPDETHARRPMAARTPADYECPTGLSVEGPSRRRGARGSRRSALSHRPRPMVDREVGRP